MLALQDIYRGEMPPKQIPLSVQGNLIMMLVLVISQFKHSN